MPFKGIRFARSLSDKGFPVDICCDARVAGAIAHPADHSIRIDRDRFARFQFIDQNMLCAFCVIGFGWTVHGDFGKRNVFTGDAAHQGAECCLGETFLRSEKDFFEAVISVAAAVACDKSTGLGEDNVVACSSDFECQFVYGSNLIIRVSSR